MSGVIEKHKTLWKNAEFVSAFCIGVLFIIASLLLNYFAGNYATRNESNPVTDIVLDNVPVYSVGYIFVNGSLLFFFFVLALCVYEPRRIPFILKSLSLFIVIRSLFVSLTHIGPFPQQAELAPSHILEKITFGGDLFFSGHTGLPFLMALIFWQEKPLRYLFIAISLVFGTSVLLGHLHYSIDVFAAFFITYTIFHLAKKLFPIDYQMMGV